MHKSKNKKKSDSLEMIKEASDFFQNAKFCPILVIYNLPDDQHVQICMNSKFDAILQPVLSFFGISMMILPDGDLEENLDLHT